MHNGKRSRLQFTTRLPATPGNINNPKLWAWMARYWIWRSPTQKHRPARFLLTFRRRLKPSAAYLDHYRKHAARLMASSFVTATSWPSGATPNEWIPPTALPRVFSQHSPAWQSIAE